MYCKPNAEDVFEIVMYASGEGEILNNDVHFWVKFCSTYIKYYKIDKPFNGIEIFRKKMMEGKLKPILGEEKYRIVNVEKGKEIYNKINNDLPDPSHRIRKMINNIILEIKEFTK